ncbi:MAG: DUF1294 domain-containing protein [Burkholderiaceae bacterium]|nr:DUF1294 domain-containing protein [Burkholderiaceae bacterium]
MSVAAFAAIGRDKAAARRGERRIAEIHLHLLSVGGGWAGTWLACRVFRHKTQKRAFRRMFRLAAAANCAALAGLLYLLA